MRSSRSKKPGLIVDLYAGGGGMSTAIQAALKRPVDIAINHDEVAIAVHTANHPDTQHYTTDIWEVEPLAATKGRPVQLLHASPDCTHFSRAKGGKPRSQKIRSLADVVPRWAEACHPEVITLENVPEFLDWGPLDGDNQPIKERAGEDFQRWKRTLERLGYVVEHRVLVASHFGAPTSRKRLFVVARRDGFPVQWPEPTHGSGPGLLREVAAAVCIDWSLDCPSIFTRKKPLAEKTLARIAAGVKRYVLDNASPFIVPVNHGGGKDRAHDLGRPLTTVTAARRSHALVAPSLIQTSYGERKGQAPRVLDLHKPLGTVVAGGQKHSLVAAFLAKHYGGVVGQEMKKSIGTVTATDHHSLVTSQLAVLRNNCDVSPLDEPMPTITASGMHLAEVRAFLMAYYGSGSGLTGHSAKQPLPTITTRERFGLVTVDSVDYVIADIGMRMLEPHELLKAQFGRFAKGYDLSAATTKKDQVRLVGNSVCPELGEALIRAQFERAA